MVRNTPDTGGTVEMVTQYVVPSLLYVLEGIEMRANSKIGKNRFVISVFICFFILRLTKKKETAKIDLLSNLLVTDISREGN